MYTCRNKGNGKLTVFLDNCSIEILVPSCTQDCIHLLDLCSHRHNSPLNVFQELHFRMEVQSVYR